MPLLTRSIRAVGVVFVSSLTLSAQIFTTLYNFGSQVGDGTYPLCRVVVGQGALYGTTSLGGAMNLGTVYELSPPASGGAWTETVLHSFSGEDGNDPTAALLMGLGGALFGDTLWNATGSGTVFELDPPLGSGKHWTESVLTRFTGLNGGNPSGALVLGPNQALYGTTGSGNGTVYIMTPPATAGAAWSQTTAYHFRGGSRGSSPLGTLAVGQNGTLFGTTTFGGKTSNACPTGCGTVFSLTAPAVFGDAWTETVLYSFDAATGDGKYPYAGVILGSNGVIYGTTGEGNGGVGTVFSLTPSTVPGAPMTETILHVFGSAGDGTGPAGSLVLGPHGVLYGTTVFGGANGVGTVYELTPPASSEDNWQETILHSFASTDGQNPNGIAMGANGILYGTTGGGGTFEFGTVFSLVP